jgi:NADH-ubiquinone oxidoreductase chain 1
LFRSNVILYYFSPVLSIFLIIFLWIIMNSKSLFINFSLGVIFFFCCTGIGVYALIGRGWRSNSNYALLGAMRGVAQTISYEVRIALIFLSIIFLIEGYEVYKFINHQDIIWFIIFIFPIFLGWLISSLAETNRTPFDFAEGESELVSGFNIEYGRGGFALLFLAEYGRIIFISFLSVVLFFGGVINFFIFFMLLSCFFCFWFIWIRGVLPRHRYDKLIDLAWKGLLPISLIILFFFCFVGLIK